MAVIIGTAGNDPLEGTDEADLIQGLAGDDVIGGMGGNDTMEGGADNDTYLVDDVGDVVKEKANQGFDRVDTTLTSYTLGLYVEYLFYGGESNFAGTGNTYANLISGGSGHDTLLGGQGADTLYGNEGDDLLNGGNGADFMQGGFGNDVYIANSSLDVADEIDGDGHDTVESSANFTLGDGVEDLKLTALGNTSGFGNALDNLMTGNMGNNRLEGSDGFDTLSGVMGDDTLDGGNDDDVLSGGTGADDLRGGAGDDSLDGGSGDDVMRGGAGNDTYLVDSSGDVASETGGSGADLVRISAAFTLGNGLENLEIITAQAVNGTGNALSNHMTGGAGANVLTGLGGADTILGGGGADTILGGAGVDSLDGGGANDEFGYGTVAELAGDTVVGGAGIDRLGLNSATNWFLPGTADLTVDAIVLNVDAAGFLVSIGDEMIAAADAAGMGTLRVFASVGISNSVNIQAALDQADIENALIVDGANLNGNDSLHGAYGADTMAGGLGNDFLRGYFGADELTGGAGADTFSFISSADGYDYDAVTYVGDLIADFDAGNSGSTIDQLLFDLTGFSGIGDNDAVVEGFRSGNNAAINVAGSEIVVKTDAAITNLTYQTRIDALTNIDTGLIYVAYNYTERMAQAYYDNDPSTAGGALLLANFENIDSLAALAAFNAGDFAFVL